MVQVISIWSAKSGQKNREIYLSCLDSITEKITEKKSLGPSLAFYFWGAKSAFSTSEMVKKEGEKKKFSSDWQYRQWLIDLLCFFPSFREARETFSQNFAFKNKCTLRYQVSSLLEAKVRLLFSSFAAAWPWSRRWWSYWNFATKLKRFPGKKKSSLELLLWKTKNERIWECHGFCLAASGKFCSVWNFSVARELWFHCFFSFHCFSIIHWR